MSLNKLPNGADAPRYKVTAVSASDEERTIELIEWWNNGKRIQSIEDSARDAFYNLFDKESFEITEIKKL